MHEHTEDCMDDYDETHRQDMSPLMIQMNHRLHMGESLLPEPKPTRTTRTLKGKVKRT